MTMALLTILRLVELRVGLDDFGRRGLRLPWRGRCSVLV